MIPRPFLTHWVSYRSKMVAIDQLLTFRSSAGVRDTIDLKLVLGRLEQLRWNIKDLIEYLVQQQASFTSADW